MKLMTYEYNKTVWKQVLCASLGLGLFALGNAQDTSDDLPDDTEVYELSPFVVSTNGRCRLPGK